MPIYEKLMGNPFVDAGICGICEWLGQGIQPEQITKADLKKIVEEFVPMAANWEKWNAIFTINHVLTNAKPSDRVPKFKNRLICYIDEMVELSQVGDCIGCGRRDVGSIPLLNRTGVPLTGGKNSNFFPVFSEGAGYCPACSFAIQFLPFSLVATGKNGGRFLMLHSKSWELMRLWTIRCIAGVKQRYSQQQSGGCFKPDYENSRNGLFYMVREMMSEIKEMQLYDEIAGDVSMEVYSFTNDNNYPGADFFYIPSPVFNFLYYAEQNPHTEAWHEIVKSGYVRGKSEKDFRKTKNRVYEYLLEDRSIRVFFLSKRTQEHRGNWELLSLYLEKVKNMNSARIDKIKQVGDKIAKSIHESGKRGESRLREFADAETYAECRSVLLRISEDRIYEQKEPEPLFSFDDCMEHLFIASDDALSWSDELDDDELDDEQKEQLMHSMNDNVRFWRETRDLLLFRIYEKLHNWLIQ